LSDNKQRFTIRASASRLNKGLLAVPQKYRTLFPSTRTEIQVIFDDGEKSRALTFQPYDAVVKENRIFGLRQWFLKRGVREGDVISITLESPSESLYRIALDRFVLERQQERARRELHGAKTDSEADQSLVQLARVTRRRPRDIARGELLRIVQGSLPQSRPIVMPRMAARREVVPPVIRVLLRELHDGKCQLCSFTFQKRDGEPYFEVHHLSPGVGHHPKNLLVVCPNCHAQFEHAAISDLRWADGWLVGVAINGRQVSVRQPLVDESSWRVLFGLALVVAMLRVGRLIAR
jgi:5-methylcytosine-specific restriction endonuclease McrA